MPVQTLRYPINQTALSNHSHNLPPHTLTKALCPQSLLVIRVILARHTCVRSVRACSLCGRKARCMAGASMGRGYATCLGRPELLGGAISKPPTATFRFPSQCEDGHIDRALYNSLAEGLRTQHANGACPAGGKSQLPAKNLPDTECQADMTSGTGHSARGVAQILRCSASTAVRMARRYGRIRPEIQRQAIDGNRHGRNFWLVFG
jgi:hypothetical protein